MNDDMVAQVLVAAAADAVASASPPAAAMSDALLTSKQRRRKAQPISGVVVAPQEEGLQTVLASCGSCAWLGHASDPNKSALREFPLSAWVPEPAPQPGTSMADGVSRSYKPPSSGCRPPFWTSSSAATTLNSPGHAELRAPDQPGPTCFSSGAEPAISAARLQRDPNRLGTCPPSKLSSSNTGCPGANRRAAFTPRGSAGGVRPTPEASTRIAAVLLSELSRRRAQAGSVSSSQSPERQEGVVSESGVFLREFPLSAWATVQGSQGV